VSLDPKDEVKDLAERLKIARECEAAADYIAAVYPVAARLLMEEATRWRS
jgi:hypothetical protein